MIKKEFEILAEKEAMQPIFEFLEKDKWQVSLYLITGSLVASFIGVGLFMGDVGEAYSGFFGPIMVAVGVLSVGYIFGSVFFGRYLRRSQALTIPQYFEKRFDSKAMRILATVTGSFIMLVYSLSCVQGIATLMSVVTGVAYNTCIILAVIWYFFRNNILVPYQFEHNE